MSDVQTGLILDMLEPSIYNTVTSGSSLEYQVEFAHVLTAIPSFILTTMDFPRLVYSYHFMSDAACEATRWASVRGSTFTFQGECSNGLDASPGCLVQVVVSYPYQFMFPFLPKGATTWTVSSTAEMVIS